MSKKQRDLDNFVLAIVLLLMLCSCAIISAASQYFGG